MAGGTLEARSEECSDITHSPGHALRQKSIDKYAIIHIITRFLGSSMVEHPAVIKAAFRRKAD
jgi:hypothetical protein